jgi:hypothetical protein
MGSGVRFGGDGFVEVLAATQVGAGPGGTGLLSLMVFLAPGARTCSGSAPSIGGRLRHKHFS